MVPGTAPDCVIYVCWASSALLRTSVYHLGHFESMECLVLNTYTLNKGTLKMLRAFLCPVQRPARVCPLEKGNLESEEPERLARSGS